MLIVSDGNSTKRKLTLNCVSSSTEQQITLRIAPIFLPFGHLIFGFLNSRLKFLGTNTGLLTQIKILMNDQIIGFKDNPKRALLNLMFIGISRLRIDSKHFLTSYVLFVQSFDVDVAPSVLGLVSDENDQVKEGRILFLFKRGCSKLLVPKVKELISQHSSILQSNVVSSKNLTFRSHRDVMLFDGQFCVTRDSCELSTTPFVSPFRGFPIKGIVEFNGEKLMKVIGPNSIIALDKALFLGFSHNPNNYYHFLIELFPRLLEWKKENISDEIPVVCDKSIPWQLLELIRLVTGLDPMLISSNRVYSFNELFYCEDFRHQRPVDVSNDCLENIFDEFRAEIGETKEFLLNLSRSTLQDYQHSFLFLGRSPNQSRIPINQSEVMETLERKFAFYSPEISEWSITRQVQLFSRAKVIVAVAGAVLTNIMFCKPGTIIIVQRDRFDAASRFWRDYSNLFSLTFYELYSESTNSVNSSYKISDKQLYSLLGDVIEIGSPLDS